MPLTITEYQDMAETPQGATPVPLEPPLVSTSVLIAGTSSTPHILNARTRLVRLATSEACHVRFGAGAPVAVTSDGRMAADQTEFRGVTPLSALRVAVIAG